MSIAENEPALVDAMSGPSAPDAALEDGPPYLAPLPDHALTAPIVDVLRTIFDPEIPVNIFDLGLIYRVEIDAVGQVAVEMTLTTPNCPVAGSMPDQVRSTVLSVDGVMDCDLDLVWDPPWHPGMMTADARLALGFGD